MKKKLITILVAFGIARAEAEKYLEKVEETDIDTFDPEKVISEFRDKEKELLKNDKDFVSEIQKGEAAKRNDIWLSKVKKKTGLTADEIKAKGWGENIEKNLEDILEYAVDKVRKKGDATSEQLQQEVVTLTAELKKLKDEEIPNLMKQGEAFKKGLVIESKEEKLLGVLPKKLRVGTLAARATINQKLEERGIVRELDEAGNIVYKTKDNLKVKNKAGTDFLTSQDLIMEILDEEKLLENSAGGGTGGQGGEEKKIIISSDKTDIDPMARFPHLKKAQENLETTKAAIEANKRQ